MIHPYFNPYHAWLGLPLHAPPANHYQLLGLPLWTDDASAIEAAAEKRSATVKPFTRGEHPAVARRILAELALARQCLLSADSKGKYDRRLRGERSTRERWSYLRECQPGGPRHKRRRDSFVTPAAEPEPPVLASTRQPRLRCREILGRFRLLVAGSISAVVVGGVWAILQRAWLIG